MRFSISSLLFADISFAASRRSPLHSHRTVTSDARYGYSRGDWSKFEAFSATTDGRPRESRGAGALGYSLRVRVLFRGDLFTRRLNATGIVSHRSVVFYR